MNEVIAAIRDSGVVPVVTISDPAKAVPLAEALWAGGIFVAEITFRTERAAEAIRAVKNAFPQMPVGAGTVLTGEQARAAAHAGADFIVSPGFGVKTAEACRGLGLPYLPGVVTPTEIERALEYGFDILKFFPARESGGVPMLKALCAPYRGVRFLPTGGIGPGDLEEYLRLPAILACGSSYLAAGPLLESGQFDRITALAREASKTVQKVRKEGESL